MKPRLIAIFTLIVLTPLLLLGWIGIRSLRGEREIVEQRIRELLTDRLREAGSRLDTLLEEHELGLMRSTEDLTLEHAALRAWLFREPLASGLLLLDADGGRVHPPRDGPLSDAESGFLERAEQVWQDRQRFYQERERPRADGGSGVRPVSPHTGAHGWYVWFWGNGIQLLFWRRLDSGEVLGVELNRARFFSDVVDRLPTTVLDGEAAAGRTRLMDSRGEILYQWGSHSPPEGREPQASLPLEYPLSAWRLEAFLAPTALERTWSRRMLIQLLPGLLGVGLVLLGLAVYFYRESSRELREAARRVSFVNQVSHELKTPLTNIRMYGELLEKSLPDDDERIRRYVDVITTESLRLSRLIGNILTFAGKQRGKLELHPRPAVVDEAIESVLAHHAPSLEARGIETRFDAGAPETVPFDPDVLEQILGNLLSNAEKYAAAGRSVTVSSLLEGETIRVTVSDRGPGIPEKHREAVFAPFQRLNDRLTEGISGTGIGLAIARDLARLHGGEVRLVPSETGASFEVTLKSGRRSEVS